MSSDSALFEKQIRIENKDFFVDLKTNDGGLYLKIAERHGGKRNTVLIPFSGVSNVIDVLNEAMDKAEEIQLSGGFSAPQAPAAVLNSKVVYANGFAKTAIESDIVAFMSSVGPVVSVKKLKSNPRSKVDSALVEYSSEVAALTAVQRLNETEFMGFIIRCRPDSGGASAVPALARAAALADSERKASKGKKAKDIAALEQAEPVVKEADPTKAFITNLSFTSTNEDLLNFFGTYGVISAEVNTRRDGRSSGTGTITFFDDRGAQSAIAQLNGLELGGRKVVVREYYTK